jgi:hypothetical protein
LQVPNTVFRYDERIHAIPSEEYASLVSPEPTASQKLPEISLVPVFEAVVSTAALRVYATAPDASAEHVPPAPNAAFPEVDTFHVIPSEEYAS